MTEQPYTQPYAPPFAPAVPQPSPVIASPVRPPPAPHAEPEPHRRRSTVREPAPVFDSVRADTAPPAHTPAAAAAPEVTSTAKSEGASKPGRTGWWAKRFLGDKG